MACSVTINTWKQYAEKGPKSLSPRVTASLMQY